MTTAQQLAKKYTDYIKLFDACEIEDGAEIEQDWDNEATVYSFEDGSKIHFSGGFYEVK